MRTGGYFEYMKATGYGTRTSYNLDDQPEEDMRFEWSDGVLHHTVFIPGRVTRENAAITTSFNPSMKKGVRGS